MVVVVLVAMMLLVAQFAATCSGKMSRFLFFWPLFVLGDLLKNASRFVGRLTLLKEINELEWVRGHHLVCIRKLELMHLGLRKEDLFTLLLRHWYLPHLTEVAIIEITNELFSTPHELVHWHESKLLCSTKPADQLVANIGEPGNCPKVIPDAFVEVHLHTACISEASLGDEIGPFSQTYILKTLTHQVKQHCWTIILLSIR
jgi:hypothetical protein